jgi:hypothetical protein
LATPHPSRRERCVRSNCGLAPHLENPASTGLRRALRAQPHPRWRTGERVIPARDSGPATVIYAELLTSEPGRAPVGQGGRVTMASNRLSDSSPSPTASGACMTAIAPLRATSRQRGAFTSSAGTHRAPPPYETLQPRPWASHATATVPMCSIQPYTPVIRVTALRQKRHGKRNGVTPQPDSHGRSSGPIPVIFR